MNRPVVYSAADTGIAVELLLKFSAFMSERMGLYFPLERLRDLERGILSASADLGFPDAGDCILGLLSSTLTREQIEILASHLTVGETYFFRDTSSLDAVKQKVLPDLIRERKGREERIRIWSAGCATGEEPYSVAILLDDAFPEIRDWTVTILATDINPRFLEKAQAGVYSPWSFRDTPPWVKERYFKKTKNGFELLPRIRERVTFEYHNLAEDPYPSLLNSTNAMDLIFCRNVLMYFSPASARDLVEHFHRSLTDGGWLFVSPVETSQILFSRFEAVNVDGVTLYRKSPASACSIPVPLVERTAPVPEPPQFKKPAPTLHGIRRRMPPPAVRPKAAVKHKQDLYAKALALYEQGLYREAEETITPLAEAADKAAGVPAMALLARIMANQGKLTEAFLWCERSISSDKLNPGLYYLSATILQEQGHWEKAALALKRAVYLDRKFVLAHFALANLARRQGMAKESEKHFENTLALLRSFGHDEVLPESDGMIAGRLMEIIGRLKIDD